MYQNLRKANSIEPLMRRLVILSLNLTPLGDLLSIF